MLTPHPMPARQCAMCNGTGTVSAGRRAEKTCPNCNGAGEVG